jgi:xeroderma pigmentosum group C-complementing protein
MAHSSPKKSKGKQISSSSSSAGSAWAEATASRTNDDSSKSKSSSESDLLKRKYGGVIGRRYDGRGKLIPTRALIMTGNGSNSKNSEQKKDIHITKKRKTEEEAPKKQSPETVTELPELPEIVVDDDDDEDEDSDEDWEEVDLNDRQTQLINEIKSTMENENTTDDASTAPEKVEAITISLNQENEDSSKSKRGKRTTNPLTKEERHERVLIHQIQLIMLLTHVSIRNKYCSDFELRRFYRKLIPQRILEELHPQSAALSSGQKNVNLSQMVLTRKLLDGLRHLMEVWRGQFKVRSTCSLTMTSWSDIYRRDRKIESKIGKEKFVKMLKKFKGSRDLGAQGFCAILRAANIDARLVCSLQPLDFTSNTPISKLEDENEGEDTSEELPEPSDFPVFWVEVWDPYAQKWIAVDPMVQGIVEPASIHRKSKLEPPLSDKTNMMRYVVSFTEDGAVRDVTRRYSYYFNAKTRKKRISNTPEGAVWYNDLLSDISKRDNILFKTELDTLEDAEMELRNQAEEIPSSIQDFKGHPIYVLERHLRQNEVLEPCEPCGYLAIKKAGFKKKKNKATGAIASTAPLEKIYKRSNVKFVRSARGWYQMGRVLKPGAQPKKHVFRKKTPANTSFTPRTNLKTDENDNDNAYDYDNYLEEEDESTGLYSLEQTDLYVPPPIVDGKVTRNAYGNIDVYVPSMIPEGGVLLRYPHIAIAAKMVGIDYANAVTGFDFGSKGGKKGGGRGSASARIDGIVIAKEYEEAVRLVYEQMTQEQEEEDRELAIAKALMMWRRYVTALRIKARLERDHGKVQEQYEQQPKVATLHEHDNSENFINVEENAVGIASKESGGFHNDDAEVAGDFVASEDGRFIADNNNGNDYASEGGFVADTEAAGGFVSVESDNNHDNTGGGFFTNGMDAGGGFVLEEDSGGGFVAEDTTMETDIYRDAAAETNDVSDAFQKKEYDENAGGFVSSNEPEDKQFINDSAASIAEPATLGSHKPEDVVMITDSEDEASATQMVDSVPPAPATVESSSKLQRQTRARLRAFAPQKFDVVVASYVNPEDSLEERILKASQRSSAANSQPLLSSSANTQIGNKTDYDASFDTTAVTLVENSQNSAVKKDGIDADDDNNPSNKPLDTVSEKKINKADDQDLVAISDDEGDFFPESMSESELYDEYDGEE